jgi:hypothetical protein
MHYKHKAFFIITLIPLYIFFYADVVNAQTILTYPEIVETRDVFLGEEIQVGDIVFFDADLGMFRKAVSGAKGVEFGIIAEDPLILFRTSATATPIAQSGSVMVNVSTQNGPIRKGDFITLSSLDGIGTKALKNSTVKIGIAREDFDPVLEAGTPTDTVVVGQIEILLTDDVVGSGFGSPESDNASLNEPLFPNEPLEFSTFIRFMVAALITAGSGFFAYRMYEKNLLTGVVSIGRNPLAKSSIQLMMAVNIAVVTLVALSGVAISLLIILL